MKTKEFITYIKKLDVNNIENQKDFSEIIKKFKIIDFTDSEKNDIINFLIKCDLEIFQDITFNILDQYSETKSDEDMIIVKFLTNKKIKNIFNIIEQKEKERSRIFKEEKQKAELKQIRKFKMYSLKASKIICDILNGDMTEELLNKELLDNIILFTISKNRWYEIERSLYQNFYDNIEELIEKYEKSFIIMRLEGKLKYSFFIENIKNITDNFERHKMIHYLLENKKTNIYNVGDILIYKPKLKNENN